MSDEKTQGRKAAPPTLRRARAGTDPYVDAVSDEKTQGRKAAPPTLWRARAGTDPYVDAVSDDKQSLSVSRETFYRSRLRFYGLGRFRLT